MKRADAPLKAHVSPLKLRDIQVALALFCGSAKYLFIHIPKNAGVALRHNPELRWKMVGVNRFMLRDRAYLDGLLLEMGAAGEHHGVGHARLRDVRASIASRLQPVATLRNPWSRTASRYLFALQAAKAGAKWTSARELSFEAFLDTRHEDGNRPYFWHRAVRGWYPQLDYVVDAQGKISADLLRQEHLSQDAKAYFKMDAGPRPRNVTRSNRSDWTSLYTPKTIAIVADWYAADIDTFGFDFDTAAKRNIWADRQG